MSDQEKFNREANLVCAVIVGVLLTLVVEMAIQTF